MPQDDLLNGPHQLDRIEAILSEDPAFLFILGANWDSRIDGGTLYRCPELTVLTIAKSIDKESQPWL